MKVRPIASLLTISLTLAACADAPTGPGDDGGIIHRTSADALLVRIDVGGGFVAPQWTLTSIPALSLYGDGTLVQPGVQIELYPGPALPAISARRLSEEGIQAVLREVLDAIESMPDRMIDMGSTGIADAPTTTLVVRAGGVDRTVSAYALGELSERPSGMSQEEFQARQRLQRLVTELGSLSTWLPEGALGPETSYGATSARLYVSEYQQVDLPQESMAWPLGAPLGDFGDPLETFETYRCGTVAGDDWITMDDAATRANELTPWSDGGSEFSILFRPLLPDETGCERSGSS